MTSEGQAWIEDSSPEFIFSKTSPIRVLTFWRPSWSWSWHCLCWVFQWVCGRAHRRHLVGLCGSRRPPPSGTSPIPLDFSVVLPRGPSAYLVKKDLYSCEEASFNLSVAKCCFLGLWAGAVSGHQLPSAFHPPQSWTSTSCQTWMLLVGHLLSSWHSISCCRPALEQSSSQRGAPQPWHWLPPASPRHSRHSGGESWWGATIAGRSQRMISRGSSARAATRQRPFCKESWYMWRWLHLAFRHWRTQ